MLAALAGIAFLLGSWQLVSYSNLNRALTAKIRHLETELGVLNIDDPSRVYFSTIEKPFLPDVIAEHVERVWQYRYYFPPGYEFKKSDGAGRIAADGFYWTGGTSTSWSSPSEVAIHKRMSISIRKNDKSYEIFIDYGGGTQSCRWRPKNSQANLDDFVIEPVLVNDQRDCSYAQDEIIPIFRIYDPASAKEKKIGDRKITTYSGALAVIYPVSQEAKFKLLRQGIIAEQQMPAEDKQR